MDSDLPIVYLLVLLAILASAGWFILRQIIKTRKIETTIFRLEGKLGNEKGTAQEYYELGSIYLDKKLYAQATSLFQKALKAKDLEVEEDAAVVYNALGFAHFGQEQYDMAIRQYKEAIRLKPDYVTAFNNLAHAYERKKANSSSVEMYEEALKRGPKNGTAKSRAESLRKRLVTPA